MPEVGDKVWVSGLSQTEFNGSGTVAGPLDEQKGRWPIQIGSQCVLIKSQHLIFLPDCLGPMKLYILQSGLGEVPHGVGKEIMRFFKEIIAHLEAYQDRKGLSLSERNLLSQEILRVMPQLVTHVKDHTGQMSSLANVLFGYLNEVATWVVPSHDLIQAIIRYADGKIAEGCAGSGLMAALLQDLGQEVIPFDSGLRHYGMTFTLVKRTCGSCYPFEQATTLLICWPERDPSNDSKMQTMVTNFHAAGGTTVLVSGTPPNEQGKCYGPQGTQALWDCLFRLFTETARIPVPSFMNVLPDCLVVLKRK